jgi:hypothetical protein
MPFTVSPRRFSAAALAVSTMLLTACGTLTTVPIGDDARARIHVVSINPSVTLPAEMTFMGTGQGAALLLGGPLVGTLIASKTAETPKAELAAAMQANHIVLGDILAAEFAKQASHDAGTIQFVVGTAPADAQVELSVVSYGISQAHPLGSALYPLINVNAVMKTPDGRVVWQASEFAGPHNPDNKVGHTYDEYVKDPELLRQGFVTGSDIAAHLLAENLMGREKQAQNIPGTQR